MLAPLARIRPDAHPQPNAPGALPHDRYARSVAAPWPTRRRGATSPPSRRAPLERVTTGRDACPSPRLRADVLQPDRRSSSRRQSFTRKQRPRDRARSAARSTNSVGNRTCGAGPGAVACDVIAWFVHESQSLARARVVRVNAAHIGWIGQSTPPDGLRDVPPTGSGDKLPSSIVVGSRRWPIHWRGSMLGPFATF
jgi:hypothetical protein